MAALSPCPQLRNTVLICSGEPAGVGPDLCLMLPRAIRQRALVMGDRDMLKERAQQLNLSITLVNSDAQPRAHELRVHHIPLRTKVRAGRPDRRNVAYVLQMIQTACAMTREGAYLGLITAPFDKSIITRAGHAFTGLTPYLHALCGTSANLTLFVGEAARKEPVRVAFASMHIPLAQVASTLNARTLQHTIQRTHQALRQSFNLRQPRLALCGLNPHAGEHGVLGRDELNWINDCAKQARRQRIDLTGPLAADSLFTAENRSGYDAIIALFHDQGLAPFKALTFGRGAQVTFGLPFLRASPDHGTAYALAGQPARINCGSMIYACRLLTTLTSATKTLS